jgi:hypothetical protein
MNPTGRSCAGSKPAGGLFMGSRVWGRIVRALISLTFPIALHSVSAYSTTARVFKGLHILPQRARTPAVTKITLFGEMRHAPRIDATCKAVDSTTPDLIRKRKNPAL